MGTAPLPERVDGPMLVLRRWTPADVTLLGEAVARNLDHLRPWMPWIADEPLLASERRALVQGWEQAWSEGGDVVMGVFLDGQVVGGTGLHRRRGPHGLEIGYWVDRFHLGRGIATETARMLSATALSVPDITFVEIHHDKANLASGAVPRHLGYEFLGESPDTIDAPGEIGIDWAWRMTAEDWWAESDPAFGPVAFRPAAFRPAAFRPAEPGRTGWPGGPGGPGPR